MCWKLTRGSFCWWSQMINPWWSLCGITLEIYKSRENPFVSIFKKISNEYKYLVRSRKQLLRGRRQQRKDGNREICRYLKAGNAWTAAMQRSLQRSKGSHKFPCSLTNQGILPTVFTTGTKNKNDKNIKFTVNLQDWEFLYYSIYKHILPLSGDASRIFVKFFLLKRTVMVINYSREKRGGDSLVCATSKHPIAKFIISGKIHW